MKTIFLTLLFVQNTYATDLQSDWDKCRKYIPDFFPELIANDEDEYNRLLNQSVDKNPELTESIHIDEITSLCNDFKSSNKVDSCLNEKFYSLTASYNFSKFETKRALLGGYTVEDENFNPNPEETFCYELTNALIQISHPLLGDDSLNCYQQIEGKSYDSACNKIIKRHHDEKELIYFASFLKAEYPPSKGYYFLLSQKKKTIETIEGVGHNPTNLKPTQILESSKLDSKSLETKTTNARSLSIYSLIKSIILTIISWIISFFT